METNLKNRVRNLRFQRISKLTPIFEAISNSLHAILLSGRTSGRIKIAIERDKQHELYRGETKHIRQLLITDDGIGFNDGNFNAFGELDTDIKQQLGSKGIGRLFWLKVFDHAQVSSVYREGEKIARRDFTFRLPDGIADMKITECKDTQPVETQITLYAVKEAYQQFYTFKPETLRDALIHHFMPFFATQFVPEIEIWDEGAKQPVKINAQSIPKFDSNIFEVNGFKFKIIHIKLSTDTASSHAVHFCAADRVVKPRSLSELLGNFTKKAIREGDSEYFYGGYIVSDELSERVVAERDDFHIEDKINDLFSKHDLSWDKIEDEVKVHVENWLQGPIEALRTARDQRIENVFTVRNPELAYLQRIEKEQLSKISIDASEKDIALNINRLHFEKRRTAVDKLNSTLNSLEANDLGDFEKFRSKFSKEILELSEVGQADLASYMLYRQKVLSIMHAAVKFKGEEIGYEKEKVVHSLFFPRFQDSEGAEIYDGHNLWLLDESLAFETYITSDVPLNEHRLLISDSNLKPDLVMYGLNFGISFPSLPFDHITIVEFKRPGIGFGPRNPIGQIYDAIDDINAGKVRDFDGMEVRVNHGTRFFGIVLCDAINDAVAKAASREKLFKDADGLSYHGSNPDYNLYLRIISYRQVYDQACRRHQKFFESLGIQ